MARHTGLIKEMAESLSNSGKTATFGQVGEALNDLGITTTYGTLYSGSRGTAKIVQDAYRDLENNGDPLGASKVAKAFTDDNGNYSWDK